MRYILTGGIASGKSTVVEILKQHSIKIIDADLISRQVFSENEASIREILDLKTSGNILRKDVGNLVFTKPKMKFKLETFMHPLIRKEMDKQERELKGKVYVLDIPLYFEQKLQMDNDFVIVMNTPYDTQLQRLMKRNDLSKIEADKRILSQLPTAVKIKKSNYIIDNTQGLDELKINVDKMLEQVFDCKI